MSKKLRKVENQEKTNIQENSKNSEELKILTNEESDDEIIEAKKEYEPIKPNKVRTEKQIEATKKMRERLKEATELKKKMKEDEELNKKKELEKKIVEKAISIKKKEIKKQKILDEISDDDSPIEEVKKIIKKTPIQQKTQIVENKPKYIFI